MPYYCLDIGSPVVVFSPLVSGLALFWLPLYEKKNKGFTRKTNMFKGKPFFVSRSLKKVALFAYIKEKKSFTTEKVS